MDAQPITGRGRAMLNAMRARGDWMTRADLAHATGKNWISPNDLHQLARMAAAGLIEIREHRPTGSPRARWEYRIKGA